jgi:hypothetical protein
LADLAPAPAAPAQPAAPATPTTQSAPDAAVATGNTSAYREARRAERLGRPLDPVPVAKAEPQKAEPAPDVKLDSAAPAQPEPKPISKRQEATNDAIRRAAEAATAQLRDENARLQAELAKHRPAEPAAPAQPATDTPAWKRYAAMPDAPKLEEFDSVPEFSAAMSLFIQDTRESERAEQVQHSQALETRSKSSTG